MLYAIKNIKERIVSKRQGALLLREVAALSLLTALECPNLIQYYSSWIEEGKIYIQLEWCNLGSLEDIIAKNPSRFSIFANRQTSPSTRNNRSNSVNMMLDNRNRSDSYQSIESMEAYTPIGLPETTSIFDFINQTMEGISEVFAWHILKVLSQALHFMHSRGKTSTTLLFFLLCSISSR